MLKCCAPYCNYKHKNKATSNGKTVHRFPFSRPEVVEKWLVNMRRVGWQPCKRSVVCSDHFEKSCYEKYDGIDCRINNLKKDAVPTIFAFPLPKPNEPTKKPIEKVGEILPPETFEDKRDRYWRNKLADAKLKIAKMKKLVKARQRRIRILTEKNNYLKAVNERLAREISLR